MGWGVHRTYGVGGTSHLWGGGYIAPMGWGVHRTYGVGGSVPCRYKSQCLSYRLTAKRRSDTAVGCRWASTLGYGWGAGERTHWGTGGVQIGGCEGVCMPVAYY